MEWGDLQEVRGAAGKGCCRAQVTLDSSGKASARNPEARQPAPQVPQDLLDLLLPPDPEARGPDQDAPRRRSLEIKTKPRAQVCLPAAMRPGTRRAI